MFLRAGFNAAHRVIAHATVASRGIWRVRLIVFEHGGDLAWHCKGRFLIWAEAARVCNLIGDRFLSSSNYFHDRPCSPWPRPTHLRAVA